MASIGVIYDMLKELGLVDGHRTEPITDQEVQLLNQLLKEGSMDQLLDAVPGQDPDGQGADAIALPENQTDAIAPPWD